METATEIHAQDAKFLIQNYHGNQHVSLDTLRDFEKVIAADESVVSVSRDHWLRILIGDNSFRLYRAFALASGSETSLCLPSWLGPRDHMIKILMGPGFEQCLPYFFSAKRKSIYLFDAWEESHARIEQFVKCFSINDVFFSSSQVTEKFRLRDPSRSYHWIPEGVDPAAYRQIDYAKKDLDVLQLGRKFDAYHGQIVELLQRNGFTYLYERVKGQVIFPMRADFVDGLARSKVSICVPSNITHPERSGAVSTMTNRYLQSMVSKSLVVGVRPAEMNLLFDYDPMIEIDKNDPFGQLQDILDNYDSYIPLIEKNFEIVCNNHTWSKRWELMKTLLLDSDLCTRK